MLPPNTVPPDVALLGAARSGKSAAAALLTRKWGHAALGFADPLREMAAAMNPFVGFRGSFRSPHPVRYREALDAVGYERLKVEFPEARRFLQVLGTEAGRDVLGENVWVEAMERRVEAMDEAQPVVLHDVRFSNEVAYARDAGMVLVRLTREGSGAGDGSGHVSEALARDASVDVDFTFSNDGPLDDLEAFLDGVVLSRARSL